MNQQFHSLDKLQKPNITNAETNICTFEEMNNVESTDLGFRRTWVGILICRWENSASRMQMRKTQPQGCKFSGQATSAKASWLGGLKWKHSDVEEEEENERWNWSLVGLQSYQQVLLRISIDKVQLCRDPVLPPCSAYPQVQHTSGRAVPGSYPCPAPGVPLPRWREFLSSTISRLYKGAGHDDGKDLAIPEPSGSPSAPSAWSGLGTKLPIPEVSGMNDSFWTLTHPWWRGAFPDPTQVST